MQARNYESRVATAPPTATARELAERLSSYSIGSVVVVDDEERPLGIVTDRDLLVRVVAAGHDPDGVRAEELMTKPLVCASSEEPIDALIQRMASARVRRLPVVADGRLVGLVALDDLLVWLVRELDDLSEATRREITQGWKQAKRARKSVEFEQRLVELGQAVRDAGDGAAEFAAREVKAFRERLARLFDRSVETELERRDGKGRGDSGIP